MRNKIKLRKKNNIKIYIFGMNVHQNYFVFVITCMYTFKF
jgi:hypothetical protein